MQFIGVDLAWSYRNSSAAFALTLAEGVGIPLAWDDQLLEDAEIVRFIASAAGDGPALVAVDAPLIVANESGTRPCDRELSRFYWWAEAGTYPANRRLSPHARGEKLVAELLSMGFIHSPTVVKQKKVRQVVEVYPHPAMIELFSLGRTLKYKARPGRSYQDRWQELAQYIELLRSLSQAIPKLEAESLLSEIRPWGRRGRALKRLEDLLDALFCAYIALYLWYWGEHGYHRFGDLALGYILVPVRPERTAQGHHAQAFQ